MTTKPTTLPVGLPGTFTTTGWEPPDRRMYPDEWELTFTRVVAIGKSNPWHKGDLLRYGEARYGERYAQAVDDWMMAYGSLANYTSICNRFPPARRRAELSFSHHQEVAYMEPEEADLILHEAVKNDLRVGDLRELKARYQDLQTVMGKSTPSMFTLTGEIEEQIVLKRDRALTVPDPSPELDLSSDDLTARRKGEGWPDLARRLKRWYWEWRRRAERLEAENAELRAELERLQDERDGSLDEVLTLTLKNDWRDAL